MSTLHPRTPRPSASRPMVGKPTPWEFPRHEEFYLSNGLRVWTFDLPGQLVLSANLALDVPLSTEPRGLEGIATLAAEVSDEGTVNYPSESFAEAIEGSGISLHPSAHWSTTLAALQVSASQFHKAFALLTEILTGPVYSERDITRHIEDELVDIADIEASPAARAWVAMSRALFSPDCRMATRSSGTEHSIASLTPELVRAFHDAHWTPVGATLVVAGALPNDLPKHLEATIGGWSGPSPVISHEVPTLNETSSPLWLIDHPGAAQATLAVSCLTPTRDDPRWAEAQLACTAMGGSFGSRLNTRLREERGYTYGASCRIKPERSIGVFSAGLNARTDVAADALCELFQVLDLADGPLTAAEIDAACDYRIGVSPLSYDNAHAIANQAAVFASHGVAPGWFDEFQQKMLATTPEQATQVFADWLAPEKRRTVIAGDASVLLPALRERGFDPEMVGTFD